MKGFVTVDTPEDFQKWLAEQAVRPASRPGGGTAAGRGGAAAAQGRNS